MSIFYRLYQSKNDKSVTYGKWYGRAVTMGETVSLEDLAEHEEALRFWKYDYLCIP